jgi:Asp/Glu/hydantoin racemase
VLEQNARPEKEVLAIMCDVGKTLVNDGVYMLTRGCAGMTNMKAAVGQTVGNDVQVVDGVLAGVQHLIGLCQMGAKTEKRGMFASAAHAPEPERRRQD